MSHSLSSWLNHIKSDDIDGGLAADFDGSLSGLGADLSSSAYNMSEALLALPPVFKQEAAKSRNAAGEGKTDVLILPSFSGYQSGTGRSLTLPGRSSPTGSSTSYQSVDMPISGTHSLSMPNLQQHSTDSTGIMADAMNTEWVSLMTSMNLGEVGDVEDSGESRFQYILNAATSPATRMSEETLTYLNQGQSYEIKLKRLKEGNDPEEQLLKSIVRVVFHERRLQYMEKEQLDVWKLTRPGERIVDIDIPLCRGLIDVKIDPHRLNCVEFVWDPRPTVETKVAIKIHCISTEFTAKKHGGEKGVPFRIQVETYTYSSLPSDNVPLLLNCASCQVKIFKPKGADRKHKTDREKIERRSTSEKEKYQPSYECTVLTEIPLDQVHKYLELLNRQLDEDDRRSKETNIIELTSTSPVLTSTPVPGVPPVPVTVSTTPVKLQPVVPEVVSVIKPGVVAVNKCPSFNDTSHSSPPPEVRLPTVQPAMQPLPAVQPSPVPRPTTPLVSNFTMSRKRPSDASLCISMNRNSSQIELTANNKDNLLVTSTAEEVAAWLTSHRFGNYLLIFQDFAGADLLRLCREDLIQICGTADGIRLYNALQAKTVRPKLTIYVSQTQTTTGGNYGLWNDVQQAHQTHIKFHSQSSTPSPPSFISQDLNSLFSPQPPTAFIKTVPGSESTGSSWTTATDTTGNRAPSTVLNCDSIDLMTGRLCSDLTAACGPGSGSAAVAMFANSNSVGGSMNGGGAYVERRETGSQTTCFAAKRQMPERDEEDDEVAQSLSANKKQRMQSLELSQRSVYHALYLDSLTEYQLREKLAQLFDILPSQILELFLQGPSGIHILVTDLVVQNFKDQSSFTVETVVDSASASSAQYRLILKYVEIM